MVKKDLRSGWGFAEVAMLMDDEIWWSNTLGMGD